MERFAVAPAATRILLTLFRQPEFFIEVATMAKKKTAPAPGEEPTFEEALEELETIVRRLEQGGGALEEALSDYSTAIGLLKSCNGRLESAERRVEILSGVDAQGNPVTRPVVENDSTLEQKQQARSGRRSASAGRARTDGAENSGDVGLF